MKGLQSKSYFKKCMVPFCGTRQTTLAMVRFKRNPNDDEDEILLVCRKCKRRINRTPNDLRIVLDAIEREQREAMEAIVEAEEKARLAGRPKRSWRNLWLG